MNVNSSDSRDTARESQQNVHSQDLHLHLQAAPQRNGVVGEVICN